MDANADIPWNFLKKCELINYRTRFLSNNLRNMRQHQAKPENHGFTCHLHSPEKYYKCEKCQFQTHFKTISRNHLYSTHKLEETRFRNPLLHRCPNCNFRTYSLLVLLRHICIGTHRKWDHHEEQKILSKKKMSIIYQCDHCSYKVKKKSDLRVHILNKHNPSEQISCFKCEHCTYRAKEEGQVRQHVLEWHSKTVKPKKLKKLKCHDCPFITTQRLHLQTHMIYKHPTLKQFNLFKCEQCPYKAKKELQLRQHTLRKHISWTQPLEPIIWVKCEQCSYITKRKDALRRHMIRRHLEPAELEKLLQRCRECSYKTVNKTDLRYHVLRKHTPPEQINWFKCEECPYKAKQNRELRQHVFRMHTTSAEPRKRKRHKCEYCSYEVTKKMYLKQHVLQKHTSSVQIN